VLIPNFSALQTIHTIKLWQWSTLFSRAAFPQWMIITAAGGAQATGMGANNG
jgi:hypothetical protein